MHKRHYDPDEYARKHGLIKREESRGIGSSIRKKIADKIQHYNERNTPARRRERIEKLRLVAQEEAYKSKIYKAKAARGGSTLNKIIHGSTPKSYRQKRNTPRVISQPSNQFTGMDQLFGGNQQPQKYRKSTNQPRSWQGMDDLF